MRETRRISRSPVAKHQPEASVGGQNRNVAIGLSVSAGVGALNTICLTPTITALGPSHSGR
jgi:hypothetical protein